MDWKNKPHPIFNKVKLQMFSKGVENFHFIQHLIQQFDPQNTRCITLHCFNILLNKAGVFLTTQELRNLRDIYSHHQGKNSDNIKGLIHYRDFLEDVKYSIPEKITFLLNDSFEKLDPQKTRIVSIDQMRSQYCSQKHPHVLTRRKTPQEVLYNFTIGMTRKSNDGQVTKEGFIDYYAQLNFCIPVQRQNYFKDLLTGTWSLSCSSDYVSVQRLKQLELILYEKIRQKSTGKIGEWKTAKKALSYFDLSDSSCCNYKQFLCRMDKFGCNFKPNQSKAMFDKYDIDKSGKLQQQQFSKFIMDLDINGMIKQPNLLTTLGTSHFKLTL